MKKILVAEDDKNLSRSVDILLTLDGHQVISVYNGEEALNQVFKQKYDLLITDIVMPRLSGVELVDKIRKLNPAIPIMVVSGKLNQLLIKELEDAGVQYVLPKPINPTRFRKMVQKVFQSGENKMAS